MLDVDRIFRDWALCTPGGGPLPVRDRVLAQIVVDAYQLKTVDAAGQTVGAAAAVAMAERVAWARSDRIVLVLYAGRKHAGNVVEFFGRAWGSAGTDWRGGESRGKGGGVERRGTEGAGVSRLFAHFGSAVSGADDGFQEEEKKKNNGRK